MKYEIFNEDCNITMTDHIQPKSVDVILTSPPYCTSNRAGKNSKANLTTTGHNKKFYPYLRYDVFLDNMSTEEYIEWSVKLFNNFDTILKENGSILYNISYSSGNVDMLFRTITAIIDRTDFTIADMIGWKKHNALPNNISPNKLTRIFEPVFVFCRKSEFGTFFCNKTVTSVRKTGQKVYGNIFNFIDARNNDGSCKLNKATYSSELCIKLLSICAKPGFTVYDPFMGTGTTAVACKMLGMDCYGSELSAAQIEFAKNRIDSTDADNSISIDNANETIVDDSIDDGSIDGIDDDASTMMSDVANDNMMVDVVQCTPSSDSKTFSLFS
jgi:DNA modification methylase